MKELFIQYVLPPVLTALGLGAAWVLTTVGAWAQAKWKDSKVVDVVARVSHFAGVVVQDIEATLRPEIHLAVKDGQLTRPEGERLKTIAMERLKAMLGAKGLQQLSSRLGVAPPALDAYLSGVIEKRVATLPP